MWTLQSSGQLVTTNSILFFNSMTFLLMHFLIPLCFLDFTPVLPMASLARVLYSVGHCLWFPSSCVFYILQLYLCLYICLDIVRSTQNFFKKFLFLLKQDCHFISLQLLEQCVYQTVGDCLWDSHCETLSQGRWRPFSHLSIQAAYIKNKALPKMYDIWVPFILWIKK